MEVVVKRAIICLAICWSIIGCTLVNLPEPKVSADGKSVTYEYMHISKTVEIEYGLMSKRPFAFPPQNLKIAYTSSNWKFYKAEKVIPEITTAIDLAVSKDNRVRLWFDGPGRKLTWNDIENVEFKIIQITEEI